MPDPSKEGAIIIKRRRRGGHAGSHGGTWKVAYADFVTAMMAFFIVLWILGQGQKVKEAVAAYFKDPGAYNFLTGKRTIPIDLELVPEKGRGEGEGEGQKQGVDNMTFTLKLVADSMAIEQLKEAIADSTFYAEKVESLGKQLQEYLKEMIAQRPDFEEILSSIKIELTDQGLKISLVETTENMFFEIGSAVLKPEAVNILQKLGVDIGKMPNSVDIEGHTDARQYGKGATYGNWELSADRANAARRVLARPGYLREGQITQVTGYADRQLSNPSNPFDNTNRRVTILIRQLTSKELIPKQGTQ